MKYINSKLYMEFNDLVSAGVSASTIKLASHRSSASWEIIKDPSNRKKILIGYEELSNKHKDQVIAKYGDPYAYMSKEPIRNMVIKDLSAEKFFFEYKLPNNTSLTAEAAQSYTTAASWLNMLIKADSNKKSILSLLNLSASEFWNQVEQIIKIDQIDIPASYKRIRMKMIEYQEKSYECLIHKQHTNNNATKICDEESRAILLKLIAMPNQDDEMTCRRYNTWAAENNKQQISISTVGQWRRTNEAVISQSKYGVRETYNKYGKHIHRDRPSGPLVLVENDDNDIDIYFTTDKSNYKRYVLAVVIDSFNDYVLGWAYGESYTNELIKNAYLDAAHHIHQLTGKYHLFGQIKSDRFGINPKSETELSLFLKSLATFTPAAARAPRGKYIEQAFGKKWHKILGCYPNYAGGNVTSKRRVPQEVIKANIPFFPSADQAHLQISHFIHAFRHLIQRKSGLSKQEEWLAAYNNSALSQVNQISEEQFLYKLGTRHPWTNTITAAGIVLTLGNEKHVYEVPTELFDSTIGKTIQVVYDKLDSSRILAIDDNGKFFIARKYVNTKAALADFQPGDARLLYDRINEKRMMVAARAEKMNEIDEVLTRKGIDAESYIMAGVHTKAINQEVFHNYNISNLPTNTNPLKIEEKSISDMIDQL